MLQSWFSESLDGRWCESFAENMELIPDRCMIQCAEGIDEHRYCIHIRDSIFRPHTQHTGHHHLLLDMLLSLTDQIHECHASMSWFSTVIAHLAAKLNSYTEAMEADRDIVNEEPLQGPQKRMRLDIDKIDGIHDQVAAGKAKSVQAFARATGAVGEAAAQAMCGKWLSRYAKSIQLSFTKGDVGFTMDGTRAGNPAEENLVSIIWSVENCVAAVLPIKVICEDKLRIVAFRIRFLIIMMQALT